MWVPYYQMNRHFWSVTVTEKCVFDQDIIIWYLLWPWGMNSMWKDVIKLHSVLEIDYQRTLVLFVSKLHIGLLIMANQGLWQLIWFHITIFTLYLHSSSITKFTSLCSAIVHSLLLNSSNDCITSYQLTSDPTIWPPSQFFDLLLVLTQMVAYHNIVGEHMHLALLQRKGVIGIIIMS